MKPLDFALKTTAVAYAGYWLARVVVWALTDNGDWYYALRVALGN